LGYIRGRKREEKIKETKEESPSMVKFVPIAGKEREALEFQARGGGKNTCFPWEWAIGKKTLLDKSIFSVREYTVEKVCA
jgi:hypothetical protein